MSGGLCNCVTSVVQPANPCLLLPVLCSLFPRLLANCTPSLTPSCALFSTNLAAALSHPPDHHNNPHNNRETCELVQHPNGAAPTCHTVFAVDRGCPWQKAKKLLDEEVRLGARCLVGRELAEVRRLVGVGSSPVTLYCSCNRSCGVCSNPLLYHILGALCLLTHTHSPLSTQTTNPTHQPTARACAPGAGGGSSGAHRSRVLLQRERNHSIHHPGTA